MKTTNVQSVNDLLQQYLDQIKREAADPIETVASEAKALGISAGTLSQLRNGKPITDKVIAKIANTIAAGDESHYKEIEEDLVNARRAALNTADITRDSLDDIDEFLKTSSGQKRLICVSYRDIPQSREQGDYPGYVDRSAKFFKSGLSLAMFQVFGPLEQIKQNAKAAYDIDDVEASGNWNYIYKLASGVREVFQKTKRAVESDGSGSGQIALYERANTPPLSICDINARLFYSHQISEKGAERKIRIAHLIKALGKEVFIESASDSAYHLAVAAQFQPILRFWITEGRLPILNEELKTYQHDNETYSWNVIEKP